jgi:hypothetical protein
METMTAQERLFSASLPEKTDSYTPIAHKTIDDTTRQVLKEMGFGISKVHYRSSTDGMVGQAEYHLNYGDDPEMGLMVAWQNSYNKLVSFKYAVGAHVFVCANGCVSGDLGAYRRKHTGSADEDAYNMIRTYLYGAKQIFDKLVADREHLKKIELTPTRMAELMGRMFIEKEIISSTQINIMKRELDKPTYDYGVPVNNAWSLYNFATHAFKEDSPRNWMKRHVDLHNFFAETFNIESEEFIPQNPPVEQPSLFVTEAFETFVEMFGEEKHTEETVQKEEPKTLVSLLDEF